MARDLVARAKMEIEDEALRGDLLEFIETIIMYKVSRLTCEEIKTMLQLHDIRESRAYQEAKEEGRQEGRQEGEQKTIAKVILKLAARKVFAEEIAATLEVELELVQKILSAGDQKTP